MLNSSKIKLFGLLGGFKGAPSGMALGWAKALEISEQGHGAGHGGHGSGGASSR